MCEALLKGEGMILICCVEDQNGLCFNHRRLSSDAVVTRDILMRAGMATIWTDAYSAKLFDSFETIDVEISEYPYAQAAMGEYVFVERSDPAAEIAEWRIEKDQIEGMLLYHWNRRYPSDVKLTLDTSDWQCVLRTEFAGKSHENVTLEILKPQAQNEEEMSK